MIKKHFCHFSKELLGSLEQFYLRNECYVVEKKSFDFKIQDQVQFNQPFLRQILYMYLNQIKGVDPSIQRSKTAEILDLYNL